MSRPLAALVTLVVLLPAPACGPEGIADDTDTDTETDSEGTSGTGSGSAEEDAGRTDDGPPATTISDETGDPPDDTTGDCPVGTENCLCDVGAVCEGDLVCERGVCVGPPACEHPEGEPNDDEASAIELPDLGCGDPPATTSGVLDGVDADWFTFGGNDGVACFGGPSAQVTSDAEVVLCMFFECNGGMTSVQCDGSSDATDSPEGRPGCCGPGQVDVGSVGCGFGNPDSAQVYMRVSTVDAACQPYELEYEF